MIKINSTCLFLFFFPYGYQKILNDSVDHIIIFLLGRAALYLTSNL